MSKKGIFFIVLGALLLYGIGFGSLIWCIKEDKKEIKEKNDRLEKEQAYNSTCSITRDSLARANADLSKYKTLTMAMVNRDEVTGQLKHRVGELVYMKNDSAKVVIEDVLIGGGKYNYYVKYKVLYKDHSTKEVTPELIY